MGRMFGAALLGAALLAAGAADAQTRCSDPAVAQRAFAKCQACHSLAESAPHLQGPNLYGVIGRTAGTVDGFRFSPALRRADFIWSRATLDRFLADPQAVAPGNRMPFAGLSAAAERQAVICALGG